MFNLIRMNLYRMLHTTSIKIILIIMMLFAALNVYMCYREMDAYTEQELAAMYEQQTDGAFEVDDEMAEMDFGFYINPPVTESGVKMTGLGNFTTDLASCMMLLFVTIATTLFFNSEEKHGFVKNVAGQVRHKCNIYFSKVIVMALYLLISFVLYFLADAAAVALFVDGEFVMADGNVRRYILLIGIQFILALAYTSGIGLLATLTKSNAATISLGLLFAMGFGSIASNFIYMVSDVNISKYLVVCNIKSVVMGAGNKILVMALVVGLIYTIVYNVVGSIWFTKRDVV